MVQPVKKSKDISVIVWAAFSGALGKSDLVVMERDVKALKGGYSAESYLKVLEEQILRIWEPGLIFIQDNALIHKASIITKFFKENRIKVLKWPPYSPDLNLIKHIWFLLKEMVYKVNPDIKKLTRDKEIREALGKALKEA